MKSLLFVSLGVFVGNWALTPFMREGASFTDGFVQGLGAAVCTLLLGLIFRKLGWAFQS